MTGVSAAESAVNLAAAPADLPVKLPLLPPPETAGNPKLFGTTAEIVGRRGTFSAPGPPILWWISFPPDKTGTWKE
jgi:hypothetical protein